MAENEMKRPKVAIVGGGRSVGRTLRAQIDLLEELEAYRAIGTVDQCSKAMDIVKAMIERDMEPVGIEVLQAYIHFENELVDKGFTVKSLLEARERMEPKKVLYRKQKYGTPWLCPECEADQIKVEFFNEDGSEPQEKHTFCWKCGTVIDWSE